MKRHSKCEQLLLAVIVSAQLVVGAPQFVWAQSSGDDINEQIRRAESDGRSDGRPDGSREGNDRGLDEGRADGYHEGRRIGFETCEREERQRAYDDGYREGVDSGQSDGDREGRRRGDSEGRANGLAEGESDGIDRARTAARRDSFEPGSAQGRREADASDALAAGRAAGLHQGDIDAAAEALRVEYPRGRKEYAEGRWAERVDNQDTMQLHEPGTDTSSAGNVFSNVMRRQGIVGNFFRSASPDYRYSNPRRSYNEGRVQNAYNSAYRSAYQDGFSSTYSYEYNNGYRYSYDNGHNEGCYDARRRNYSNDEERGRREGYQSAYDTSYRYAYDRAYRPAYDTAFRDASDRAYRSHYDGFYTRYFEEARAAAYTERYNALFQSTYRPAYAEKYAQMYPVYAKQQYDRGVADEAEDFRLRPIRLLEGSVVTETIHNGLYEPGEALRVKFKIRNFAATALSGSDARLKLTSADSSGAVISEGEVTLPKSIQPRSITEVTEALEFRMSEKDADKAASFNFNTFYQGRAVGSKLLTITTKFMTRIRWAEDPKLQEGMLSPLFVMVSNQSQVKLGTGGTLTMRSDPKILEIEKETMPLSPLSVNGTEILQYHAIVRSAGANPRIPFGMEVLTAKGRRIGLIDETRAVPILNDYRVQVVSSNAESALRTKGLARLTYRIRNVSSRAFAKGLQMKIRFKNNPDGSHLVIGPNPQYLAPLQKDQSADFVVPISVVKGGASGIMELEVFEDGKLVVIHQLKF